MLWCWDDEIVYSLHKIGAQVRLAGRHDRPFVQESQSLPGHAELDALFLLYSPHAA
jgi:hypothetical protein